MKYPKICKNCISCDKDLGTQTGDCTFNPVCESFELSHYCGRFEYNLLIQKEMSDDLKDRNSVNIWKFWICATNDRGWYVYCKNSEDKFLYTDGTKRTGLKGNDAFWTTRQEAIDFVNEWRAIENNK